MGINVAFYVCMYVIQIIEYTPTPLIRIIEYIPTPPVVFIIITG